MPQVESKMIPLGTKAPSFTLPDAMGEKHSLDTLKGKNGTLIIFMCNHCPFVKFYFENFNELEDICKKNDIKIIGINPNDAIKYPDDSPEKMIEVKKEIGFNFTYLVDQSQETAQKYQARCTPDSYLFNSNLELFYRGQLDNARPSNGTPPSLEDIKRAIKDLANKENSTQPQIPSIGCGIKWKEGNEPE